MMWAFAAAGATGVPLGLWFRVTALAAVSAFIAAICLSAALFAGMELMGAMVLTFAFLAAIQVAYLAGSALSYSLSRATVSPADLEMLADDEPPTRGRRRVR